MSTKFHSADHGEKFKTFLAGILMRGKVNDKLIKKMTSGDYFIKYSMAFTHKSYNPINNYEYQEFFGDRIVNLATALYIKQRFPDMTSVAWLSRIMQSLSSKNILGDIALENGFWEFVKFGYSLNQKIQPSELDSADVKKKVLGDLFESMLGTTCDIINSLSDSQIGFTICYNIVCSYLQERPINIKVEDVFDAKSRLKNVTETNSTRLSSLKDSMRTKQVGSDYVTTITTRVDSQKTLEAKAISNTKRDSEDQAATIILEQLKTLGIEYKSPKPYIPIYK